jgi:hypothetical protein
MVSLFLMIKARILCKLHICFYDVYRQNFGFSGPRLRLVLLFANNWSSDLIYGCFRSLAKKFPIKNFALGI